MVRVIIEERKTQTRRVVKPQPPDDGIVPNSCGSHISTFRCPYGSPGDTLWVRETWCEAHPLRFQEGRVGERRLYAGIPGPPGVDYLVAYRADGELLPIWHASEYPWRGREPRDEIDVKYMPKGCEHSWMPSIFMPRAASRITLKITDVRAERLHAISEEDAWTEGVQDLMGKETPWKGVLAPTSVHAYATLWEKINGPGSWGLNPWVWAVSFERVSNAK